jgi:hypothetical protein
VSRMCLECVSNVFPEKIGLFFDIFGPFLFEPGNQDCREQAGDQTDQGFERLQHCGRNGRCSVQAIRQYGSYAEAG